MGDIAYLTGSGLISLAFVTVPGLAMAALACNHLRWNERLLIAPALGVAGLIVMWWLAKLALPLMKLPIEWILAGVVVASIGILGIRFLRWHTRRKDQRMPYAVLALLLVVLVWRMIQIRDLAFPPWVDSVHHATLIRKILDVGQVPDTLSPYIDMPLFYHFGFHVLAASMSLALGMPILESMLITAQVLQVCVVASVCSLAGYLWRHWHWQLLAAVLVTWVSGLPGFYSAWGKYPLLTAVAILPLAIRFSLGLRRAEAHLQAVLLLVLCIAAIGLTHTFTAVLLMLFTGVLTLTVVMHHGSVSKKLRVLALMVTAGALGLAIDGVWLWRVWQFTHRFIQPVSGAGASGGGLTMAGGAELDYLWALLGPSQSHVLFLVAAIGFVLAWPDLRMRPLLLWVLGLCGLALPASMGINPLTPERVVILLFLPITLFATYALRWLWLRVRLNVSFTHPQRSLCRFAIMLFVGGLTGLGLIRSLQLTPVGTILASSLDLIALRWIQANTPPESRFLISVVPWTDYGQRGTDGGWWILPLTGRHTTLPPALFGLGNSQQVELQDALSARIGSIKTCDMSFWRIVQAEHLTHIYVNLSRGIWPSQTFVQCSGVREVYRNTEVVIYRLDEGTLTRR